MSHTQVILKKLYYVKYNYTTLFIKRIALPRIVSRVWENVAPKELIVKDNSITS